MPITIDGTNGITQSGSSKANAYLDAAGGNTATINGAVPVSAASPALTGIPTAPTATAATSTTQIATTAFATTADNLKANIASPALTGQVSFDDGSAAAPAITNAGDTNTGIFFFAADTVAVTTGGTERMRIDSAGQIGIGGANYGTSGQVLTSGGASAAPSWATAGTGFAGSVWTAQTRSNGTTYQNTTTGWLAIGVRDSNNGQTFSTGPSSASFVIATTNQGSGAVMGLVPPSYYYSVSGSSLQSWYEGQA